MGRVSWTVLQCLAGARAETEGGPRGNERERDMPTRSSELWPLCGHAKSVSVQRRRERTERALVQVMGAQPLAPRRRPRPTRQMPTGRPTRRAGSSSRSPDGAPPTRGAARLSSRASTPARPARAPPPASAQGAHTPSRCPSGRRAAHPPGARAAAAPWPWSPRRRVRHRARR